MRIATWNVNGLRSRLDFMLHWLDARKPDIVGIQELKLEDDQFPHMAFESAGYHAVSYGQKAWNGVAILSREPAQEVLQRGLPGQEALGSRLLSARVSGIDFTTVYVPNGKSVDHEDFPAKLAWLDDLASYWRQTHSASDPAVLCGDFNLCPRPIDSHRGDVTDRIFHTDEERGRWRKLLDDRLVDCFRELYPEQKQYSWWDYRGGAFHRGLGLRIDFVLATPELMGRVRSSEIDRDYRKKKDGLTASDHAPVWIDLGKPD